jgi:hypothetical protein
VETVLVDIDATLPGSIDEVTGALTFSELLEPIHMA